MASDQTVIAIVTLLATMIVAACLLRGWQGWLALKQRELDRLHDQREPGVPGSMARIELADLRERIRKLESIAAGVDL